MSVKVFICEFYLIIIMLTNNIDTRHTISPEEIIDFRNYSTSIQNSFENYSSSGYLQPTGNVFKRIVNALPSLKQILGYGSRAVHLNEIQKEFHPDPEDLNYLLITSQDGDNVTISLNNSEYLFNHLRFHMNWNVVLFVSGWNLNSTQASETILELYEAYKCRGGYNFLVLDTSKFINSMYAWSEFGTEPIGELIGDAIFGFTRLMPYERVHVIGHAIGAQIAGMAGRHFTKKSEKALMRITGLDPSRPCFSESDRANGLQRGDALFVDIIHSHAEYLRSSEPIGDVDFYPNGPKIIQNGCWSISCSSIMAYQFYAETVYPGNEFLFNATKCESYGLFRMGNCSSAENEKSKIPLGFATPNWARGTFYLTSSFLQKRQKKQLTIN